MANEESEEDMMRRRRESLDPSYNLKVRVLRFVTAAKHAGQYVLNRQTLAPFLRAATWGHVCNGRGYVKSRCSKGGCVNLVL